MEMPTPSVAHAQLARLAGNWEGQETLSPSPIAPQGGVAVGRYHCHMALHDFFLLADYEQERDGAVTFRGHGVFGWEEAAQRYSMYWFDSTGYFPRGPASGSWDGDTLTLAHEYEGGHARYVWTVTDGTMRLRIENSRDGRSWTTVLAGTYTSI
jgi:hypothetical protein